MTIDIIIIVLLLFILFQNINLSNMKKSSQQNEEKKYEELTQYIKSQVSKSNEKFTEVLNEITEKSNILFDYTQKEYDILRKQQEQQLIDLKKECKKLKSDSSQIKNSIKGNESKFDEIIEKCNTLEKNINIMEEIFRLQLVNYLVDDAEDALRIYEEHVSNK